MSTNQSDYDTPERVVDVSGDGDALSHDDIAKLARAIWEARGGGDGGAEEDWLEAERQLLQQSKPISNGNAA
jgi:hypothetical protein